MAKKAIPLEDCIFCGQTPCGCESVGREKQIKTDLNQPDKEEVTKNG